MHRLIILGAALIFSVLLLITGRGDLTAQTAPQVSLLPADQIGAQASADIGFAELAPPQTQDKVRHVDPDGMDDVAGTADDASDAKPY